ncbi:ATP-binding protein [Lunatibacter salilacus]|uniref:ATP-binding protein n=1 Tax=Lunatibacter salilacus TaxID=2483804 RepID=UPI00131C5005|nr:ATP-binding protein [Lunatibacter salilacus]
MKFDTRKKVVTGFILAISLIAGVSTLTYFSVKNLLESVDTLSEPNERLIEYNRLLSDVYRLDRTGYLIGENEVIPDSLNYLEKIEQRIDQLEENSQDPIEIYKLTGIRYNIEELLEVHNNLSEVKGSLSGRDFSKEALDNIERRIQRQKERRSLQDIDNLYSRLNPTNRSPDTIPLFTDIRRQPSAGKLELSRSERRNFEAFFDYLETNLEAQDTAKAEKTSVADSVLLVVKNYILELTNEERQLRSRLANLEQQLTAKNRELIFFIQDIITSLQNEALRTSRAENSAAYDLTYQLSILLAVLTLLGVIGSAAFIFSIIKEINKAETYHSKLEEAKIKSDNLAKAKQEFLANMSHEIRNPLHVIQGYHEVLEKTPLNEEQREYLKMSNFASDTLLGVVNDILDFSKLEAGKINVHEAPFDPKELFEKTKEFYNNQAMDKGLALSLYMDLPQAKWLLGDELRIRQIMNNLLSNALKFTEEGEVSLTISYNPENELLIKVTDTGMGMSPEVQEKIFAEFNQGDGAITRKYGGTGLGLTIVKKLTEIMHGKLNLKSEVGVGSTFEVCLPMETVEPEYKKDVREIDDYSLDSLHILLVDDDPIVLKFTRHLLSSLGAKVSSHLGGSELVANFKEDHYDLAMFDIQMPEVSGYDALRWIKKKPAYKDLPVLALTANVYAKERESLQEVGFTGLILKPFKEKQLIKQMMSHVNLVNKKLSNLNQHSMTKKRMENRPYDLAEIAKFCMGDDEMLQELVEDFYTHTRTDLKRLDSSSRSGDYDQVREIAHQLASRLSQFKIESGSKARHLEDQLKANNRENVGSLVTEIVLETNVVLDQMVMDSNNSVPFISE